MKNWLDSYKYGGEAGYTDVPFKYNSAWGGQFQTGGNLPGSTGMMYARTNSPAPSEGPYAKKTMPSAEYGMSFYQHGLDWKPKNISKNGSDVPKNQNAEFILPRYDMPRAASESTSTGVESLKRNPELEHQIAFQKFIESQPQLKKASKTSEADRKRKNKAYAASMPNAKYDEETGDVSAINPNMTMAGEPANFMGERQQKGYEHVMGALEAAGYAEGLGALTGAARKAALESMESGMLSNTYKLNPWRFKPNPEAYYRGIGKSGLDDALESGVLRSNREGNFGDDLYLSSSFDEADYYANNKLPWTIREDGRVVDDLVKGKDINTNKYFAEVPKQNVNVTPHYINNTQFISKDVIPIDKVKLLQKDWLRGYKPIEVPRQSAPVRTVQDWLDNNAEFINLERASSKPKSKMYKASEIVEDPNFNIKKIYRGDKEVPKVIRVQGNSGEWTVNRSSDGSYYFNAGMSSPFESGKAMSKINELLPPKPVILEPNSLSLDSYKNVLKLGKKPHWKMEFENYIPLNHSAIHDKTLINKFGLKPEATHVPFNSLEDANIALKEVNAMLKKQGIKYEADVFGNGNGWYGIKIPNFKLTRDYKQGGVIKDDRGQWAHPGEITEIQGNKMATHGYGDLPLYVVPDVGEPRMVEANTGTHTFPGATKFTEYPITNSVSKKSTGGWLNDYN